MVERVMRDVPAPRATVSGLGKRVLVALEDPAQAQIAFAIGARIAAPDGGIIRGLLGSTPADKSARDSALAHLRRVGYAIGVDTDPKLIVRGTFAEAVVNAAAEHEPSLVLVCQRSASTDPALGGPGEAVAASIASPVAVVIGETDKIRDVLLIGGQPPEDGVPRPAAKIAAELAMRIGGKNLRVAAAGESDSSGSLQLGQLAIAPTASWQALAATDPPAGAVCVMVLEPRHLEADGDHSRFAIQDLQI
jgi:hypothetical protein